jgi:DNA-directed RNA polymerase specialized sigma24 family protein
MLIKDAEIVSLLRKIIARFSSDATLQDDLMQECLIRLWSQETEHPGRTRSWYLQNCRFHLQHWLAMGRSVDSLKRANGENRIAIDTINNPPELENYHTNGELLDVVSARDIASTLAGHLKPPVSEVLRGLADGLALCEIAAELNLSYPTALKYRRKIATLAVRLGISPLPDRSRRTGRGRPGRHPNAKHFRSPRLTSEAIRSLENLPELTQGLLWVANSASAATRARKNGLALKFGHRRVASKARNASPADLRPAHRAESVSEDA